MGGAISPDRVQGFPVAATGRSHKTGRHFRGIYRSQPESQGAHYGWRPNLPDEADNHLVELALAGGARTIVTWNLRDLGGGEMPWPGLQALSPKQFLKEVDP